MEQAGAGLAMFAWGKMDTNATIPEAILCAMRNTRRYPVFGSNSLWQMYSTVPFRKVVRNAVVNKIAQYCPFFALKNSLYRRFLGMKVGDRTAIAFMVTMDMLFPELISIGGNTIIGYNTTILTHEYLITEYRLGEVRIGDNVLIGANTTILPGVTIGDGAVVSACSLVNRDIPEDCMAGGNPVRVIREKA
jgi:acetyltransferase-like isoleucine patch superfamily enzyme